MAEISATLVTLNEADDIRDCLESVSWCDEIVVVDSYSDDATVDIAREYTDKIYQKEAKGFSEPYREFSVEQASNEWILIIDADERIPKPLAEKLQDVVERDGVDAVEIPRKNLIGGQWIRGAGLWPGYNVRLFRRDSVELSTEIHSYIEPTEEALVAQLSAREEYAILHDAYKGAWDFLRAQYRYAGIKAEQQDLPLTYLLTAPMKEFLVRYWKGHRLGWLGFKVAVLFTLARVFDGIENIRHRFREQSDD